MNGLSLSKVDILMLKRKKPALVSSLCNTNTNNRVARLSNKTDHVWDMNIVWCYKIDI